MYLCHCIYSAVEVIYSDDNRTKLLSYDDVGDGAAWTGAACSPANADSVLHHVAS